MPRIYALKIRKSDLALITMLNDGIRPPIKRETYLIFEISEDGRDITTNIMTTREMDQTYEISGHAPLLLRLKK